MANIKPARILDMKRSSLTQFQGNFKVFYNKNKLFQEHNSFI